MVIRINVKKKKPTKKPSEIKNIKSKETLKRKPLMKPSEIKNMIHKRETIKKLLAGKKIGTLIISLVKKSKKHIIKKN